MYKLALFSDLVPVGLYRYTTTGTKLETTRVCTCAAKSYRYKPIGTGTKLYRIVQATVVDYLCISLCTTCTSIVPQSFCLLLLHDIDLHARFEQQEKGEKDDINTTILIRSPTANCNWSSWTTPCVPCSSKCQTHPPVKIIELISLPVQP